MDGQPAAGAEVVLEDLAALDAGLASGPDEHRAVTDASGRFRFEHLAAGSLHLRASSSFLQEVEITAAPGLPLGEWRITARRASSYLVEKTVRLTHPGEELALDLAFPEGAAVTGLVLLDGRPLAGALVALGNARTDSRQARQTTTRADGSFAISAVEPGTWKLLVLSGDVRHVVTVEVPQHGDLILSLTGGSSR